MTEGRSALNGRALAFLPQGLPARAFAGRPIPSTPLTRARFAIDPWLQDRCASALFVAPPFPNLGVDLLHCAGPRRTTFEVLDQGRNSTLPLRPERHSHLNALNIVGQGPIQPDGALFRCVRG